MGSKMDNIRKISGREWHEEYNYRRMVAALRTMDISDKTATESELKKSFSDDLMNCLFDRAYGAVFASHKGAA